MALEQQKSSRFYLPGIVVPVGHAILFIIFLIGSIPLGLTLRLRDDIDDLLVRFIILLVGLVLMLFIFVKFLQRCLQKPSRTRVTVLFGLTFFLGTIALKLFTSTVRLENAAYGRYFYDFTMILMILSLYHFVVFGIIVLISPKVEERTRKLKITSDMLVIIPYLLFLVIQSLNTLAPDPFLEEIIDIAMFIQYALVLYCLVLLVIMGFKTFKVAGKTSEEAYKSSLQSLGISFFILLVVFNLVLVNAIGDYSKALEVVVIGGATTSFFFIYKGIISPKRNAN